MRAPVDGWVRDLFPSFSGSLLFSLSPYFPPAKKNSSSNNNNNNNNNNNCKNKNHTSHHAMRRSLALKQLAERRYNPLRGPYADALTQRHRTKAFRIGVTNLPAAVQTVHERQESRHNGCVYLVLFYTSNRCQPIDLVEENDRRLDKSKRERGFTKHARGAQGGKRGGKGAGRVGPYPTHINIIP